MQSFFEVTAVCVKKMDTDPVQDCGFCGASASVFCSECGETYCQACPEGSLGTRPLKNRKGGSGTSAGVEVYTAEC